MGWVGLVGDVRALALPHPPYSPSFPPVSLSSPFVYDRNSKCPRLFFVFHACVLSCLLLLASFFSTGIGSFVCFFVSSHLVLVFSCSFLFLVSFLLPPASDVFRSPVVGGGTEQAHQKQSGREAIQHSLSFSSHGVFFHLSLSCCSPASVFFSLRTSAEDNCALPEQA